MRITEIEITRAGQLQELSGRLGNFRLWWRFPADCTVWARGDAFLTMALLPAMAMGEPVEVESSAPVSPKLFAALDHVQDIFCDWDARLRKVPLQAALAEPEPADGVGSCFSGGVDAGYTYCRHAAEISHWIFLRGHEIPFHDTGVFDAVEQRLRTLAAGEGKTLVWVETNRQKLNMQLERLFPGSGVRGDGGFWGLLNSQGLAQGSILAATALALGLKRVYIASDHTYRELFPWSSHPVLTPLWSTEATEFVLDGAEARRSEKLRFLSAHPELMNILRVCREGGAYNCGACGKCVRTRLTLRLLGLSAPTLPPLHSLRPLRKVRVADISDWTYFEDNLRLAEEAGDRAAARVLRWKMLCYSQRELLKKFDEELLGGALKQLVGKARRLRPRRAAPASALPPKPQPALPARGPAGEEEMAPASASGKGRR
ncbi:MAG TPA: hypothetical protein VNN17_01535 [Terriglobia bacterium]|nr:hypothetical protein [Terriglobia bacterium]